MVDSEILKRNRDRAMCLDPYQKVLCWINDSDPQGKARKGSARLVFLISCQTHWTPLHPPTTNSPTLKKLKKKNISCYLYYLYYDEIEVKNAVVWAYNCKVQFEKFRKSTG